ncbi:MAG TPA: prepilin-type N-terminal cleavage/methylation domain-containing protein [bacterium]|nr:prepilin-type N-terminal cleavage/methylation domain-containing protein [bacterium]
MKLKAKIKDFVKPHTAKRPVVPNSSGFTMIELIVALAISVIIVAAAGFILLTQSGVIRLSRSVSTEQQRLNMAFGTVRYSFRMAGFDYGQKYFIQTGAVPPVQIVKPEYPTNPYEILVSYDTIVNGSNPCTLTPVSNANASAASSEFDLSGSCNINNFYAGQTLNITNSIPLNGSPLPAPPIVFCVTSVQKNPGSIQVNPGKGGMCAANPVPPRSIGGGDVSVVNQVLFYWGNTVYNFNPPFDIPGNLYKCTVNPIIIEKAPSDYTAPICVANTTVMLSDYVNNFKVSAFKNLENQHKPPQPYAYDISITGESNVALSDSPSYSVHVPYNSNPNGADAKGNAGQIVGNNVLKVLNSNVFLRNVYYGR